MLLEKFQSFRKNNCKGLAVLIDPDKADYKSLVNRVQLANKNEVDFFFLGGSMIDGNSMDTSINTIKEYSSIPIVLFPGSPLQLNSNVDAVMFLSLISGRNPDYLIGNHVISAPYLKKMGVEVLSTGYMLVDGGIPTTASYVSNSFPLPNNKPEIAQATAMAGEMLGMSLLYLDAGSGAAMPVSNEIIQSVSLSTKAPLIVGGGITEPHELRSAYNAGADIVVVGNAIERNAELINQLNIEKLKF
ncbi:MAG: geranylgeranylglyceryl/heptaprenylglyceryl phosphate synthase [Salibacteraceae bacterium]